MDHLGATIIGGMVLLILITIMLNLQQTSREIVMENMVQTTVADVAAGIESDFIKIGYRVPRTTTAILDWSSSSIAFLSDIDNNGTIDTVRYYLGNASELSRTPNPSDRPLYRLVNGQALKGSSFGCTDFQLAYYDGAGQTATAANQIRAIGLRIAVQGTAPVGDTYAGSFWQSMISPMNLSTIQL